MTNESPSKRAISQCEIDDVFVVASDCWVSREFNQTQLITEVACLSRCHLDPAILWQTRTPIDSTLPPQNIVRYFMVGELRVLANSSLVPDEKTDIPDSDLLARIKLTFAIDYRAPKELLEDKDAISSFGGNAVFHAWPFWREAVNEAVARMRLPRVTVPMLRIEPGKPPINSAGEVQFANSKLT